MNQPLETGKLPPELLAALLSAAPALPPEVRLGARIGEDASGIDVQEGTLVVAADPITLTTSDVARLSVLVNANDVAVCGARPRWFLAVVLVPPATSEDSIRDLFARLHAALEDVGASLVGGHTEVTPAVTQPIVFGTMLGITERGAIVETAGLAPGDVVLQVRPVPIEGAAVLANEAAERLVDVGPGSAGTGSGGSRRSGHLRRGAGAPGDRARCERAARPDGGRPPDGSA